jgi:signal recognition particle receptor subunit beta
MNPEAQPIRGESTAAESTVETPRRVPVQGLARVTTYIRGKEILILGPGRAGKTKFAQYLRLAALDPEGKREMTYAVTKSPAFVLDLGREEGLVLRVRRAVDTPGQVGPLQHALLVARRRPHAVIVMLDCSGDPMSTLRWFYLFCNALDAVLRKVPYLARRLQEMVVLLNKRDKIDDREFAKLRQAVRKVLERHLTVVWGEERVRSIPILECISVRTGRGTALIDGVVAQLTQRLAGRQDPPGAGVGPRLVVVSPAGPRPCPSCRPAPTPSPPPGHPPAAAPAT